VPEARLEDSGSGLAPAEAGWFVVNARDAEWHSSKSFGSSCIFEGNEAWFQQLGINLSVLEPGQPNDPVPVAQRERADHGGVQE